MSELVQEPKSWAERMKSYYEREREIQLSLVKITDFDLFAMDSAALDDLNALGLDLGSNYDGVYIHPIIDQPQQLAESGGDNG